MKITNRKIIQVYQLEDSFSKSIFALCDDSTLWKLRINDWERLPNIPQDEIEEEKTIKGDLEKLLTGYEPPKINQKTYTKEQIKNTWYKCDFGYCYSSLEEFLKRLVE